MIGFSELSYEDLDFITGGGLLAGDSRTAWKLCEKYKTCQDYLWAQISQEEKQLLFDIECNQITDKEALNRVYM